MVILSHLFVSSPLSSSGRVNWSATKDAGVLGMKNIIFQSFNFKRTALNKIDFLSSVCRLIKSRRGKRERRGCPSGAEGKYSGSRWRRHLALQFGAGAPRSPRTHVPYRALARVEGGRGRRPRRPRTSGADDRSGKFLGIITLENVLACSPPRSVRALVQRVRVVIIPDLCVKL